MDDKEIDYKRAAEQLRKGEPLFGKDGALAPMLERILNAALEGEKDAHLTSEERSQGNRRNGKMPKQVQTCYGAVIVETPRDRDGSFEPQTVKLAFCLAVCVIYNRRHLISCNNNYSFVTSALNHR